MAPLLAAIDALKTRSAVKRKSLRKLRDYVESRMEMLDYRGALAKGWDIGSGPTEAMYKNLSTPGLEEGVRPTIKGQGKAYDPGVVEAYCVKGARLPAWKIGSPLDIANAVASLVIPLAHYITGVKLRVDGGRSLSRARMPAVNRQAGRLHVTIWANCGTDRNSIPQPRGR